MNGISVNGVSIALNNKAGVSDEMRAKILRTVEKMGYLEKKNKFVRTFSHMNLCIMMQKILPKALLTFCGRKGFWYVENIVLIFTCFSREVPFHDPYQNTIQSKCKMRSLTICIFLFC